MRKKLKKQKIEQAAYNRLILDNKNDEIEDTFVYQLHEERYFNIDKLIEIINYSSNQILNADEKNVLKWLVKYVDDSFLYHKDIEDLYTILNYSSNIEDNWNNNWKLCLNQAIK